MSEDHYEDEDEAKEIEIWWHLDTNGRKIGWMWPEDFEAILHTALGGDWKRLFAMILGEPYEFIDKLSTGELPITRHMAFTVETLILLKNDRKLKFTMEAPWLPNVVTKTSEQIEDFIGSKNDALFGDRQEALVSRHTKKKKDNINKHSSAKRRLFPKEMDILGISVE